MTQYIRQSIVGILIFMISFTFTACGFNQRTSSMDEEQSIEQMLKVHFIDVGQADSILIGQGDHNMLIDAGNNGDSELVVNYLKNQGVKELDYVIGTHPHEDHIGGLDAVINTFDIGKVLMPQVTTTTKTFEDVLLAIEKKGLKITTPKVGEQYSLGEAQWVILAPNGTDYKELNNYSIVSRLVFGETSFIFTGDAEDQSEMEILAGSTLLTKNLQSDVLKVGHHGSSSSTTEGFLQAVKPKYAVISCGVDNKYGHPHEQTMERLKAHGITVYRTDQSGTVVAASDGKEITFNGVPGNYRFNGSGDSDEPEDTDLSTRADSVAQNENKKIQISSLDKKAELITITNCSDTDVNITGWEIVSVTGGQAFTFPQCILKAGTSTTVGGFESKSISDFDWEEGSGIWSNSKSDPAELYDANGVLVSRLDD